MENCEVVTQPDGKRAYCYLKAIPMGKAGVKCHGAAVDPLLRAKIHQLYPEDKGVGFAPAAPSPSPSRCRTETSPASRPVYGNPGPSAGV
jgi:hypothetical protein